MSIIHFERILADIEWSRKIYKGAVLDVTVRAKVRTGASERE